RHRAASLRLRLPPIATLFPYTTLFRSPPLPSLFTFHVDDERLKGIQGVNTWAEVEVPPKRLFAQREDLNLRSQNKEEPLLRAERSEEHTSELQSRENLVCRLLLEKKKN